MENTINIPTFVNQLTTVFKSYEGQFNGGNNYQLQRLQMTVSMLAAQSLVHDAVNVNQFNYKLDALIEQYQTKYDRPTVVKVLKTFQSSLLSLEK